MLSAGSLLVLPAAFLLDVSAGDPPRLPHPVRWMGKAIVFCEPRFRRLALPTILCGGLFTACLVLAAWILAAALLALSGRLHPFLRTAAEILLVYYSISTRSLADAAADVHRTIDGQGLHAARKKLAMIVGRDVAHLDEFAVRRALVETLAENLVDGVISPLFYAAIGGAPLAVAYKMVNTLDSMVGYKNETYRRFGKAAARLDDAANFLPARLAVPVIAAAARLLGLSAKATLKTAFREGSHHASPNAGYPEAAFAGALSVRLNGPNTYGGRQVAKPWVGIAFGETHAPHVHRACGLMWLSSLLFLMLAWGLELGIALLF